MTTMLNKIYAVLSLGVMLSVYHVMYNEAPRNKVVLVMLDGFRYDYIGNQFPESLPGFAKLWRNGVRSHSMKPMFPIAVYPEWTTLVTGLWAESHGILGDYMPDVEGGKHFQISDPDSTVDPKWWKSEPIWTTAAKEGLRTGVLHWSRCDVLFDNVMVHHCEPFSHFQGSNTSLSESLNTALDMLNDGFDFIQIYDSYVAEINTEFGPESQQRKDAVSVVDDALLNFLNAIEAMGIADKVNIILLSGHGSTPTTTATTPTTSPTNTTTNQTTMSAVETVRRVELDDYLLVEYIDSVVSHGGRSAAITVKEGFLQQVYDKLHLPGTLAFKRSDIPDNLHFKDSDRAPDILVLAQNGTYIMQSYSDAQMPPRVDSKIGLGMHGYMPSSNSDMRGIFFASGPDFKKGHEVPSIQMVDVYPLLTYLLVVEPNPNNGSWDNVGTIVQSSFITKDSLTHTTFESKLVSHFSFNYTHLETEFIRMPFVEQSPYTRRNISNDTAVDFDALNLEDYEHDNSTRTLEEYMKYIFDILSRQENATTEETDLKNETENVTITITTPDTSTTEPDTETEVQNITTTAKPTVVILYTTSLFDQASLTTNESLPLTNKSDDSIVFENGDSDVEDTTSNSFYSWFGIASTASKGFSVRAGVTVTLLYSAKVVMLG